MQILTKKLKNGFALPEYGLGTWQMGGRETRNPANDDESDIRAIQEAVKLGVTHIDTAELYAAGHAEELVARAIREGQIDRKGLFIVSKVLGENQSYDGVINSCQKSLNRLETDYLDLYLLHEYTSDFPLKEAIRALNDLMARGLVKNIGVSNFGVEHLKEAQGYSKYPIVCDQVHYNLRVREIERSGLLKYCQDNDIMIVAYRPTEKAALLKGVAPVLDEICKKYNKTAVQVAINWLISQPNVVTLAKTSKIEHLKENLGALGWRLETEDIERLRREFPNQIEVSEVISLG